MKHGTLATLFIIILVINLPIITAQQLNLQQYSGRDNINGFVGRDDTLTVKVTTPGTVSQSRLRIYSGDTYFLFDTCTPQNDVSTCAYTKPLVGFYGTGTLKVRLYDTPTAPTPTDENTFSILTDVLPPTITTFTVDPAMNKDGHVQLHYIADDRAFNPNDAQTCSGLKEIAFTYGKQRLFSEPGDKLCHKENIIPYTIPPTSTYQTADICATATDQLGQTSTPSCKTFTIDTSPPDIQTLQLFDQDNSPLTHAHTNQQISTNIYVTIQGNGDDVSQNSVLADLSKLNPTLSTRPADLKLNQNTYIWNNVLITTPATCSVMVSATDLLGNSATKTLPCSIGVDDTGPALKGITTGHVEDSKQLLGINGTITAEFDETGVGMNKANAFLDLSQIGGGTNVKANKCSKTGQTWTCDWNVKPTISGTKTISLTSDTADDLGNHVTQDKPTRQDVIIDREPPTIEGIQKIRLVHNTVDLKDVTVAGDTAEYYIRASDFDFAFANFNDTTIGADHVEATSCQPEGNKTQTCMFSTVIQNSGPYLANLTFTFSDKAGNARPKKSSLYVYGLSTETHPNYWKLGPITCSPELIDRSTASLHSHPVFCALDLQPRNKNAVPVITTLKDPTECVGNTTGLINNVELRNANFKSKHPVITLTLEATDFTINDINISCPIEIYSKVKDLFTQIPEEKIANFSLKFYNLPFGELNKNVQNDIDDAVHSAEGTLKWASTLNKFVDYATKLCNVKNIISSILGTLDSILMFYNSATILLTGAATAAAATGFGAPAAAALATAADDVESTRQSMCTGAKGPIEEFFMGTGEKSFASTLFEFLDTTCNFVECRMTAKESKPGESHWIRNTAEFFGGNPPWCSSVQNFLEFGGGEVGFKDKPNFKSPNVFGTQKTSDVEAKLKGMQGTQEQAINPKDSLFWSTTCLCVPGILYNLNKLRQIQCRYATCLLEDVKQKGIPQSYCKDTEAYQTCNFVMGEIFSVLPLTALFDKVSTVLQDVLSNPLAALQTLTGCLCGGCFGVISGIVDYCTTKMGGTLYTFCIGAKTVSKIGDAAASIAQMAKMGPQNFKVSNDWCDHMEKITQQHKNAATTNTPATTSEAHGMTK